MDENTICLIVFGLIVLGVGGVLIALIIHSIVSRRLIVEAIKGGTDPIEAAMAIRDSNAFGLLYLQGRNNQKGG